MQIFLNNKKEAIDVGLKNLDARNKLNCLALDGRNNFSATVHRDGENVFATKRLHFRGYESDFYEQAKEVGGPATVNIFVTREGGKVVETISVRNRK